MSPTIDITGLQRVVDELQQWPKQAKFATVLAITRTAQHVQRAEVAEMRDSFDRPNPFTLGSIFLKPATLSNPQAEVGIKDNSFSTGRPPIQWLRWQVFGGLRTMTGYERLLRSAGAIPDDMRMVPGKFARLDAYGNISRGQLVQILSQLRIDSTVGSTRSLPRLQFEDNRKTLQAKRATIRRAYRRAGGEYVAFPNGRGKLQAGIYLIRATAFGRADPKPVLIFVKQAAYEPRFDFYSAARFAIQRHLPIEMRKAVDSVVAGMGRRA